ncbi:hypothetical protein BH10BDE1_BH10BDE1_07810 [soil metagenome]
MASGSIPRPIFRKETYMSRSELRLFDLINFWGLPAIAAVSVLLLVLFSKDQSLRRTAIFSLFTFVITTFFVLYIKRKYFFDYRFFYGLRNDWLPFSGWNILIYLVFADFIFYFYHRFSHVVPILWIGHLGHHATDHLHFAQSVRENILIHIFILPMGLLGISFALSPEGVFACIRFIFLYQGFLHFRARSDIPFLKYIFVTPYFHIAHHSKKFVGAGQNYGGLFSVWDRIFGTHHEGPEFHASFGLEGWNNTNSLWTLNVTPATDLLRLCWKQKSLTPLFLFQNLTYRPRGTSLLLHLFTLALLVDLIRRAMFFG